MIVNGFVDLVLVVPVVRDGLLFATRGGRGGYTISCEFVSCGGEGGGLIVFLLSLVLVVTGFVVVNIMERLLPDVLLVTVSRG